jgi:hypothetical protein
VQLARRIRGLERAARRRIDRASDAELEAYLARRPPNPELDAEIATWTAEQLDAANLGVPLVTVRAMQPRPDSARSDDTTRDTRER